MDKGMDMTAQTFEKALSLLEKIVQELEAGDLPLEKALKKFEEGIAYSRFCSQKLDESEKKIALFLKDPDGTMREQPMNEILQPLSPEPLKEEP
jgi:exodeoxyribonuclease VII small subunit